MELADQACSNGFNVLIINPIAPPDGDETQLEVCDFSKNIYLIQAVEMLKEQFGHDSDVFACGFSLGSNHLLRHLGSHEDCSTTCGIKAVVSVSGAFDILTTGIDLKYEMLGIYDYYIMRQIRKPFLQRRFKVQTETNNFYYDEILKSRSLQQFDQNVRSRIAGYSSGATLWRNISCDRYLPNV